MDDDARIHEKPPEPVRPDWQVFKGEWWLFGFGRPIRRLNVDERAQAMSQAATQPKA